MISLFDFNPRRLRLEAAVGALVVNEQFPADAWTKLGQQQVGQAVAIDILGDQFIPVIFALQIERGVVLRQRRGAKSRRSRAQQAAERTAPRSQTRPADALQRCYSPARDHCVSSTNSP